MVLYTDSYDKNGRATDPNSSASKSLQQIAAAKTLAVLRNDKNAVQTLLGLGEEERQVLLPYLWQDYLQSKHGYQSALDHTALADRLLRLRSPYEDAVSQDFYIKYYSDPAILNEDKSDDEAVDETGESDSGISGKSSDAGAKNKHSAYAHQDKFEARWRFRAQRDIVHRAYQISRYHWRRPFIKWNHADLRTPSKKSRAILDPFESWGEVTRQDFVSTELSDLVSSQLLFYRIVALFGMPPPPTGPTDLKTCWIVQLRLKKRPQTQLALEDCVGRIHVYFDGHEDDSAAAIDLLNFLVSDEVVHPFRRAPLLAGRSATDEHRHKGIRDDLGF